MKHHFVGRAGCRQGHTGDAHLGKVPPAAHFDGRYLPRQHQARHRDRAFGKVVYRQGAARSDEVTCKIVEGRLAEADCKGGYLLDGFPRNLFQAQELDKFSNVDAVINIQIDLSLLMDRLCGRRVCKSCGESYHVNFLNGKTTCESAAASCISARTTMKRRSATA